MMIDGIPVSDFTAPTLLGIGILLLLFGRLIPRSTYKDKHDEANRWHEAYEKEREARAVSDAQATELLELARTTHDIIAAMFQRSGARRRGESRGEPDVVHQEKE